MERASETPAQSLCLACGLCCDGSLFQNVTVRPTDELVQLTAAGLDITSNGEKSQFRQPCSAYQHRRCEVYELRPRACRNYQCQLLQRCQQQEITWEAASKIIRETVRLREVLRAQLETALGANPQASLPELFQAFTDLRKQNVLGRKEHGQAWLDYATWRVRITRYFQG